MRGVTSAASAAVLGALLAAWPAAAGSAPPVAADAVRITLGDAQAVHSEVLIDRFGMLADGHGFAGLPPFDFTFVRDGNALVPLVRTPVANDVSGWELIVSPGRWLAGEGSPARRAEIPFALKERNADCLHYGVLSVDTGTHGTSAMAGFRIASETCQYLQFNADGRYRAAVAARTLPGRDAVIAAWRAERAARLPVRPIAALASDYPGTDPAAFGSAAEVDPAAMTAYGFVIDGRHYVSACGTRDGSYAYCDSMPLPSYSLAKSLFAGLALMRAEYLYPGARGAPIAGLVDACRGNPAWQGVSIEHALDMATGNYASATPAADEDAAIASEFFLAEEHAAKVRAACNSYARRAAPGTRWVYHTSDTYLAGTALTAYIRQHGGPGLDLYDDLVVAPLWKPLGLSPLTFATRRTYDAARQPFAGWGLSFLRDDIARLGLFLGRDRGRVHGKTVLDEALFAATMQRDAADRGLPADFPGMRYNNGFRALDVAPYLGCSEPTWVPVLSGFGGIIVILLPNDSVYYYFSDGGQHRWMAAARAAHGIRPLCHGGREAA